MVALSDFHAQGLTDNQVLESRKRFGRNEVLVHEQKLFGRLREVFTEPMVLLLLVAALLYFITGETGDGVFMTLAIVLVTGISWYQETRSRKALEALRSLTAPTSQVVRNGITVEIKREEIVVGDYMVLAEGSSVPADGLIVHSNDFSVNESILTGESLPVSKNKTPDNNSVFQGTSVVGGLAICEVSAIGVSTALGKIGKSLELVGEQQTPLQQQIRQFVKGMALTGVVIFLLVWALNFLQSRQVLDSLLKALTLAMSILPEEIPVAFTTFMALGAWRLMKLGIIVKQIKTVETLGSATVICTDKTGTITENRMTLARVFSVVSGKTTPPAESTTSEVDVIRQAMFASEPIPFDPMETALHEAYARSAGKDERPDYHMIHEYPLGGKPPMMTHIFENGAGNRIIAAKGAPEALLRVSRLSDEERNSIIGAFDSLTSDGYRVLGVGVSSFDGDEFPSQQEQFVFRFTGLVAFYDPPKPNIAEVFAAFYKAGIDVKIITGDNAATTSTIARQTNFRGADRTMEGEELVNMSDTEVKEKVMDINIFTRMFPDAKLKILNALKANGQIVAMTGDGVNDSPALKTAHIGIAMGRRGTEIAKEVSSLIITDDDLSRLVDAVAMGRKIYSNLKKAIQYIISIHIPIILIVFIPLVLGWVYPAIFSPVHVIFLELIMGPTCSIIYENEPIERNVMLQKPRPFTSTFFNWHELSTSILQGLVITAGTLFVYQYAVQNNFSEDVTRTMVFISMISANIFLTLVNRSFYYSLIFTLKYRNNLLPLMIGITIAMTAAAVLVPAVRDIFQFAEITGRAALVATGAGCISAVWYEGVKLFKRFKGDSGSNATAGGELASGLAGQDHRKT